MNTIKIFILILTVVLLYSSSYGQEVYRDNFPEGKPQLRWAFFPYFNLDNLEGAKDTKAPDGDNGIGILKNKNVGGFASLSYAITKQMENFYLEAMVYCPFTEGSKGSLVGIAFLIDPIKGNFYRIVCDFKTNDPNINLAYVGLDTRNYPVYLKFWGPKDIPGGTPKESGWHKISLRVKNEKVFVFWNEKELSGGPFDVDKIKKGFAGVYANYVGGIGEATAKVDNFMLKEE